MTMYGNDTPDDTTADDTTGTPDEVGPAAGIVPGVGPIPEPEPEGFREELIKKEEERRQREAEDAAKRSREADAHYSGRDEGDDDTGTTGTDDQPPYEAPE